MKKAKLTRKTVTAVVIAACLLCATGCGGDKTPAPSDAASSAVSSAQGGESTDSGTADSTVISTENSKEEASSGEKPSEPEQKPEDKPASPATDAPATNVPATDAPATDAPATDAPATDVPATDAPATDAPATDAPEPPSDPDPDEDTPPEPPSDQDPDDDTPPEPPSDQDPDDDTPPEPPSDQDPDEDTPPEPPSDQDPDDDTPPEPPSDPDPDDETGINWVTEPQFEFEDIRILPTLYDAPFGEGFGVPFRDESIIPDESYHLKGLFLVKCDEGKVHLTDFSGNDLLTDHYDDIGVFNGHIYVMTYITIDGEDVARFYWLDGNFNKSDKYAVMPAAEFKCYYDINSDTVWTVVGDDLDWQIDGDEMAEFAKPVIAAIREGDFKYDTSSAGTGKYGFVNAGEVVVPFEYDGCYSTALCTAPSHSSSDRTVFWKNNRIYVFDNDGICCSDGIYELNSNDKQALCYHEGYLPVCRGGKWGLIDVYGQEVVECQFEDITSVYDGMAWAKYNGKWGVIRV